RKTLSWRGCGLYLLLIWWCVLLQKVGADGAASPDGLETFYGAHFSFVVSTDLDSARFDVEGLPPGLNIDGVSGVIAGEVREVGEFEVRVSVENEVDREEILLS